MVDLQSNIWNTLCDYRVIQQFTVEILSFVTCESQRHTEVAASA